MVPDRRLGRSVTDGTLVVAASRTDAIAMGHGIVTNRNK